MRLKPGDQIRNFQLPQLDGSLFDLADYAGRPLLLSFYRFASCPFCNLRLHELVNRQAELGADFQLVAVFNASLETLTRHTADHAAPFPILADEDRTAYDLYGIEFSFRGMLKGMTLRFPTLLKGLLKGYLPTEFNRRLFIMPAAFLVDRNGIIREAYYGSDEGDHLAFERIRQFGCERI